MSGRRLTSYKPLWPYFGGKSAVADLIWSRFGSDVKNYVEGFVGSGAVLFLRPGGPGRVETINDADGMVINAWRSVKQDPETVAEHADWIVSECCLHARHAWLCGERERITERLMGDPDFCDPKAAGYWLYGQCLWIGAGFCRGNGPWISKGGVLVNEGKGSGVGIKRQRPHLGTTGQGVTRQHPKGTDRRAWLLEYLREFSKRLERVRVCCGDWSRVCTPPVTYKHGTTAVFLDPPYSGDAGRWNKLYAIDCKEVSNAVREWAIENGKNERLRVALAGYEDEHVMPKDWECVAWETHGGYGVSNVDATRGRVNKGRERLWFSPHCLRPENQSTPEARPVAAAGSANLFRSRS